MWNESLPQKEHQATLILALLVPVNARKATTTTITWAVFSPISSLQTALIYLDAISVTNRNRYVSSASMVTTKYGYMSVTRSQTQMMNML